jgi:uncharacterized membrane protein
MKIIERTLRGLLFILITLITTAAVLMFVVPAFMVVELGYTPWVLLTYVPMMLSVAYFLGSKLE